MSVTCDVPIEGFNGDYRNRGDWAVIGAAVRSMLGTQQMRVKPERRREQRYPFPYPIRLTPVTRDGFPVPTQAIVVVGKHLSEHGVDFYYTEPVPNRLVIATFERGGRDVLDLLMDLTWCRFGRHGWYENGGRFLQVLTGAEIVPE